MKENTGEENGGKRKMSCMSGYETALWLMLLMVYIFNANMQNS